VAGSLILSHPEVCVFRNAVDHPALVLVVPLLLALVVLAVVAVVGYHVIRAGVRDGIRAVERERGPRP
jgi:hypothetical protein